MNPKDYSWNAHERATMTSKALPTKSKIKIEDDVELRNIIEAKLETLTHKEVAQWALACATPFLSYFDEALKTDPRIDQTKAAFTQKIAGEMNAYEFRKYGFLANELAKESTTEVGRVAARVFAQAIASAHMRGHALVSADYAVKVYNLLYPRQQQKVSELRNHQLSLLVNSETKPKTT